jgi:dTDP-glucose 4,6-dehydratase
MSRRILVTGGAGFIGSNFIQYWLRKYPEDYIVNLDVLTYAGNKANLASVEESPNYTFVHGDIKDQELVTNVFENEDIHYVVHLAAESHVDRSILGPGAFVRTNVQGTFVLLDVARQVWANEPGKQRFLNVSTDEVYGTLSRDEAPWTESSLICPNSPYSASKASAGHLGRAYWHTYGLPVLTSHCTNNYGPYQFTEKLIPMVIQKGLEGQDIPVYGDGNQVRDWLHVHDHCSALESILLQGEPGETYNIGCSGERTNLFVVQAILDGLDRLRPAKEPRRNLIKHVTDRPGHDRRYAIDWSKLRESLGWRPLYTFESGIEETVRWYFNNEGWVEQLNDRATETEYESANLIEQFDSILGVQ